MRLESIWCCHLEHVTTSSLWRWDNIKTQINTANNSEGNGSAPKTTRKKEWSHQTEPEISQNADKEDFFLDLNICSSFIQRAVSFTSLIWTQNFYQCVCVCRCKNIYGKVVPHLKNVTGVLIEILLGDYVMKQIHLFYQYLCGWSSEHDLHTAEQMHFLHVHVCCWLFQACLFLRMGYRRKAKAQGQRRNTMDL